MVMLVAKTNGPLKKLCLSTKLVCCSSSERQGEENSVKTWDSVIDLSFFCSTHVCIIQAYTCVRLTFFNLHWGWKKLSGVQWVVSELSNEIIRTNCDALSLPSSCTSCTRLTLCFCVSIHSEYGHRLTTDTPALSYPSFIHIHHVWPS